MGAMRTMALFLSALAPASAAEFFVFFGTYTNTGKSKGIYVSRLDTAAGKLTEPALAGEVVNPSFLALHPNGRFLYSVSEIANFQGGKAGAVSAFAIDKATGQLTFLNASETRGAGPCHLTVDKTGRAVIAANYGSGSVVVLPLEEDGRVKPASSFVQHSGSSLNPKRQSGPHAHSVNLSADNRFAIVADLGLDQVLVYKLDAAKGTIEPNQPPFFAVAPGSGPRHFAFHPNGRYGYVINELASTVTAMSWDAARGVFRELGTVSTLPKGFTGDSTTAEVQVHPSGRFLYGSNRGHNSIAAFAIGPKGALKPAGHTPSGGEIPRNFGIDPTGQFLIAANQKTDSVVLFRIDQKNGALTPTGARFELGAPVCVRFLPAQ